MLVFLVVILIVLAFAAFQPRVHAEGHLDMFENDGYIAVKLFGIRLFRAAIHFESNDIKHNNLIIKSGKKQNELHLNADKKDEKSIMRILNYPAFENIMIIKLEFSVKVGKNNDAFFTSLLLSGIRLAMFSALSYVKSRFGTEIKEGFIPDYNSDKLEMDFTGIISISFADIISSYLLSKLHKKQKLKEAPQN